MNLDDVALRIFCALISRPQSTVSLHTDHLGEQQVRTCFELARTFLAVSQDMHKDDTIGVTDFRR